MQLNRQMVSQAMTRHLPIIGWGRNYQRAWLRDDVISGIVVGAVMIPVAMAYAEMAGAPPQAGLYSAILSMAAYAIFATSRHLKVTTSSTMSIMSVAVVAPLAGGDAAAFMALSSALALTVGVMMVILAAAKLGFISDFLSKSVMTGYIFGVACLIAISQLPKLFGVPGGSGTFFEQVRGFIGNLPDTNIYALAVGASAFIIILLLKRRLPFVPGALVALLLSIILASLLDLSGKHGVSVVGAIPTGMAWPQIPHIDLAAIPLLIIGAAGIVFLAVSETLGTGRTYAAKYRYEVDADQELLALGAANVSSGLFQGITVDMSLSSTASADASGGHTQLSSLVSAGLILATVIVLAPLLHNLPSSVLGAIVLASILGMFNLGEFKRFYHQRKTDFVLATTALLGVLATTVMVGLVVALLLSVVMLLYRASRPYIAVLGRHAGGDFGDTSRYQDAQPIPGLVILRLDAPLYFFNANVARSEILAQATAAQPRAILLDIGATADLDIGTSDMLMDLISTLRRVNVDLLLAQVRGSVRQRMRLTGLYDHIGEDHVFASVAAAAGAFELRQQALDERAAEAQPFPEAGLPA